MFKQHQLQKLETELVVLMQLFFYPHHNVHLVDIGSKVYRIVHALSQYLFFHQQNKSVFSSETTCARKEI